MTNHRLRFLLIIFGIFEEEMESNKYNLEDFKVKGPNNNARGIMAGLFLVIIYISFGKARNVKEVKSNL